MRHKVFDSDEVEFSFGSPTGTYVDDAGPGGGPVDRERGEVGSGTQELLEVVPVTKLPVLVDVDDTLQAITQRITLRM